MKLLAVTALASLSIPAAAMALDFNSSPPSSPLLRRVKVLEKQVKSLKQEQKAQYNQILGIQGRVLIIAQVDDRQQNQIDTLNQAVFHQGNP